MQREKSQLTFEQQTVNGLELAIASGDVGRARDDLRRFLFAAAGLEADGSLANALDCLTRNARSHSIAAAIVLRVAAEPDIIRGNAGNRIDRHLVELAEGALPQLCEMLGLKPKMQNFQKFELLSNAHRAILEKLEPLTVAYSGIDSILASKAALMGCLRHSVVRQYCRPYRIAEVADAVDSLLAKIARAQRLDVTLSDDVEACHREIASARELVTESPSFLTTGHLAPFLDHAGRAIDIFLASVRARFVAKIRRTTEGPELQKRYPLHEEGRELRIAVPMRNDGPGAATNVTFRVSSDNEKVVVENTEASLGTVPPGEFSIGVDVMVIEACDDFSVVLHVSWGELGNVRTKEDLFEVRALAQRADINWSRYKYWNPYSTAPAEGASFIGREEQLHTLVSRMLQTPMEPSYIDGQKRVGKTSLAHAAVDEAARCDPRGKLRKCYILWGSIAHEDPRTALRHLGEQIEEFILAHLPGAVSWPRGNYDGSLSPLIKLSAHARALDQDLRFAVIIDEFDEMPQDLYLQGNLAETLFANIRAITATSNICLLLVGGENMPYVMDRQGQKLNKFSRVNLTYFSRTTEWEDFERLVREPTRDVLVWHYDAVSAVFNLTNGNPYFAKIVCKEVTAKAVEERDADITADEVRRAMDAQISRLEANLFAHLWQDGIPNPPDQREPVVLKRRRTLAALARCFRSGQPATLSSIGEHRGPTPLPDLELTSLLANFASRDVLLEAGGVYDFVLPIFRMWLVDVGLSRLANDGLSEELAAIAQRLDDEAHVLSTEIVALTNGERWSTYRGREVAPENVRAWLSQLSSSRDQRLLFRILQSVWVVSQGDVYQRLKVAGAAVREAFGVVTRFKLTDRRRDVVVTYVDGQGKSGQRFASDFAEENKIATDAILSPSSFHEDFGAFRSKHGIPRGIVVIDDFVGTGRSLAGNVSAFVKANTDLLAEDRPLLQVFALFATAEGKAHVMDAFKDLDYRQIDFRAGEILGDELFAFRGKTGVFDTIDEFERAKSLATDIGAKIYDKQPLGFGGQGLLLVLPTTVPNNSLPLLHSHSKGREGGWWPLFERITN